MTYDEEGRFQEEYREFQHLVNTLVESTASKEEKEKARIEAEKSRVQTSAVGYVWAHQFPHKFILRPEPADLESLEKPVNLARMENDRVFKKLQKEKENFLNIVSTEDMEKIQHKRDLMAQEFLSGTKYSLPDEKPQD